MKVPNSLIYLFFCAFFLAFYVQCSISYDYTSATIDRNKFPPDFVFGTASSSYQYEGATDVDGRTPSIWDTFVKKHPEKISDHSNANSAEEFYYRYKQLLVDIRNNASAIFHGDGNKFLKEDVSLMKEIGLDSFRFSISWSRILPQGRMNGGVNQKGVDFYNNLIDELLLNGIQPLVTLFHWDLPQALDDEYGGFLSSKIVDDYRDYADLCFKEFGDRVKQWITFNEPNLYSKRGYGTGAYAPGRCSSYIGNCTAGDSATEPYVVSHNSILSHAAAVDLYRKKYKASQKGTIGLAMAVTWTVPKYPTISCKAAGLRELDFFFGWIIHPMVYGDYPKVMRHRLGNRLPQFTKAQMKIVQGTLDFVGVNYYTANYAEDAAVHSSYNLSYTTDSGVNLTTQKNGRLIGEQTGATWLHIYPEGIRGIALYITRVYNKIPIIVTENGMPSFESGTTSKNATLEDGLRIKYIYLHLSKLLDAIKDGANVKGYYIWSFLDNFSWASGYTLRYGVYYVDYKEGLERYPKLSAFWLKKMLRKEKTETVAKLQ